MEIVVHTARIFVMKTRIQKKWESANKFLFEKPNKTRSFRRISFQSSLLKHAVEVLFFCVMSTL